MMLRARDVPYLYLETARLEYIHSLSPSVTIAGLHSLGTGNVWTWMMRLLLHVCSASESFE